MASTTDASISEHVLDLLPDLRFDGGDVIIKLSASPEDWLLLHSEVLRAASPFLAASFKHWPITKTVKHPITGEQRVVYVKCLARKEQSLLLENQNDFSITDEDTQALHGAGPFSQTWAADRWPDKDLHCYYTGGYLVETTAHDLRILFTLLYAYPVSLEAITGRVFKADRYGDLEELNDTLDRLSNVCAYAAYYDCLHIVGPAMVKLLQNVELTWKAVCHFPERFLEFAVQVRDNRLYFDALRHLVGAAQATDYEHLGEIVGMTAEEAVLEYHRRREDLQVLVRCLEHDLAGLQLSVTPYTYNAHTYTTKSTFINALANWGVTTLVGGVGFRADHQARVIYGQWLAQQLSGQYVYKHEKRDAKVRASDPLSFNRACKKLLKAAASDKPSAVFGYRAPTHYLSALNLLNRKDEAHIRRTLDQLVIDAADIIEKPFMPHEEKLSECMLTYKSATYDEAREYFTYLPFDEEDVPWKDQAAWREPGDLPDVGTEPASEAFLKSVGMGIDESSLVFAVALGLPCEESYHEDVTLMGDQVEMPQDYDEEEAETEVAKAVLRLHAHGWGVDTGQQ